MQMKTRLLFLFIIGIYSKETTAHKVPMEVTFANDTHTTYRYLQSASVVSSPSVTTPPSTVDGYLQSASVVSSPSVTTPPSTVDGSMQSASVVSSPSVTTPPSAVDGSLQSASVVSSPSATTPPSTVGGSLQSVSVYSSPSATAPSSVVVGRRQNYYTPNNAPYEHQTTKNMLTTTAYYNESKSLANYFVPYNPGGEWAVKPAYKNPAPEDGPPQVIWCTDIYNRSGPVCGYKINTNTWHYEYKTFSNWCEMEQLRKTWTIYHSGECFDTVALFTRNWMFQDGKYRQSSLDYIVKAASESMLMADRLINNTPDTLFEWVLVNYYNISSWKVYNMVRGGQHYVFARPLTIMYVMRAYWDGELIPGTLFYDHNQYKKPAFIAVEDRSITLYNDFEVLVAPPHSVGWEKLRNKAEMFKNAIIGGRTKEGEPIYIGRRRGYYQITSIYIGKYVLSKRRLEVGWYNDRPSLYYDEIDILVRYW